MFRVHFFVRGAEKASPDAKVVIYFQLEIEGQRRDTAQSTKLKIPKRYWQNSCVSARYHLADHINRHLASIERSFSEIFDMLPVLYPNESPNYQRCRELYDPVTCQRRVKRTPKFFEVLDELIEQKLGKNQITESTRKTYRTRKQNLLSFFESNKQATILITDVKYKHIEAFQHWMHQHKNPEGSPKFGLDHISKHCTLIKQVLEYAVNREYLSYCPIGKLNLEYSPIKPPKYITAMFRKKIELVGLPSLCEARNIAIFLMYTGFSYTDYCSLEDRHLIETMKGKSFKKPRDKSKVYSLPPLLPQAENIIEYYGSIAALPRPDISDLNKILKVLGDVAGVNKETVGFNLSTSVFRETFASMMENEFMLDTRTIMYMMGHTNPRQLNNYSSVMPERILYEMNRV